MIIIIMKIFQSIINHNNKNCNDFESNRNCSTISISSLLILSLHGAG